MSFLWPHIVQITRPAHQDAPTSGKLGYGGQDADDRAPVAADIKANVQAKGTGRSNPTGLPSDSSPYRWVILIPMGQVAEGLILDGDFVTDNLGRVFRVAADYSHSLGWTLQAERMEK